MTFLERTTDPRRLRTWEGHMEADYIYTSGVAGERFFVALRDEGRLLASRCNTCHLDYLPARMFCEDCFAELTEFVDVPKDGRVEAVTVAHVDRTGAQLSRPQVWAFVSFRGIRGGLVHRLLVPPDLHSIRCRPTRTRLARHRRGDCGAGHGPGSSFARRASPPRF